MHKFLYSANPNKKEEELEYGLGYGCMLLYECYQWYD